MRAIRNISGEATLSTHSVERLGRVLLAVAAEAAVPIGTARKLADTALIDLLERKRLLVASHAVLPRRVIGEQALTATVTRLETAYDTKPIQERTHKSWLLASAAVVKVRISRKAADSAVVCRVNEDPITPIGSHTVNLPRVRNAVAAEAGVTCVMVEG